MVNTIMPKVAIIGGSIGGLTAANLLRDLGCEVDVYERTPQPLTGVGTGIVVQPELVRYFIERTDVAVGQISVSSKGMRYHDATTGRLIDEIDASWRFTSYNSLYAGLLRSFGLERYHMGEALVGLDQSADHAKLRFASGRNVQCDLAVCADGALSVSRQRLLGEVPDYAGYISWRATVSPEQLASESWMYFDHVFTYGLLDDSHIIAYPIPTPSPEIAVEGRLLNFQWYWNIAEGADLDEIMSDSVGYRRSISVHPENVQARYVEQLHARARESLAPHFAQLMLTASNPFITMIIDKDIHQMAFGRICLIGDAAITPRPHGAAGAAKAVADAWALAEHLVSADGDVNEALRQWEPGRLRQGRAYLKKVRYMGDLLQHGGEFMPGDPACRFGLPPSR